ncbi:MAG: thrombospondin type 3 repeat-containing protein, partial [Aggregatilineales bacterium]
MYRFFIITLLLIISTFSVTAQNDNDGDGIPNTTDTCPGKGNEGGLGIDGNGCPYYDADWDGVYDRNDSCPSRGNENGQGVDSNGCPTGESSTNTGEDNTPEEVIVSPQPPDPPENVSDSASDDI